MNKSAEIIAEINEAYQERYKSLPYSLRILSQLILTIAWRIFDRLDEIESKIDAK
jgi:hypothetical protein